MSKKIDWKHGQLGFCDYSYALVHNCRYIIKHETLRSSWPHQPSPFHKISKSCLTKPNIITHLSLRIIFVSRFHLIQSWVGIWTLFWMDDWIETSISNIWYVTKDFVPNDYVKANLPLCIYSILIYIYSLYFPNYVNDFPK